MWFRVCLDSRRRTGITICSVFWKGVCCLVLPALCVCCVVLCCVVVVVVVVVAGFRLVCDKPTVVRLDSQK